MNLNNKKSLYFFSKHHFFFGYKIFYVSKCRFFFFRLYITRISMILCDHNIKGVSKDYTKFSDQDLENTALNNIFLANITSKKPDFSTIRKTRKISF